jgi:AMP-activated protein kinase-like protein
MYRNLILILLMIVLFSSCKFLKRTSTGRVKAGDVIFKYFPSDKEEIETVYLTGDFNDWNPSDINYLLEKGENNFFVLKIRLEPAKYRFRFVVNNVWLTNMEMYKERFEPATDMFEKHEFGGVNAVILVEKK